MNTKQNSFNLTDISQWQLNVENSNVELPTLQRGFVWKVNQMESLWDSLLRGFPIGSFLLSKSNDKKLFLLDGQQRATSITLGFYNPWDQGVNENSRFWSLKNIPIIWIDLAPKEKTLTQKFVIRVVTQSHPWGYQRKENNTVLTISDRRNALNILKNNPENKRISYFLLSPLNRFPYDSDMPVPLSFLIESIFNHEKTWKDHLLALCKEKLPTKYIQTKHIEGDKLNYFDRLSNIINQKGFGNDIFSAIKNLNRIIIPAIIVDEVILKAEDEQTGDDPTLFVRLNSSGTRIAGEELIYSIYKASYPDTKTLVETIGASFIEPSSVISLVSRLAISKLSGGNYPPPLNVNDFRKRIQEVSFKNELSKLIGDISNSPVKNIFDTAFDILLSKKKYNLPPVVVKSIVKSSPELFLMLLQWLSNFDCKASSDEKRKILASITSLSWFCSDNTKYVRTIWENSARKNLWSKSILCLPFNWDGGFTMYPLLKPDLLRNYLIDKIANGGQTWNDLILSSKMKIGRIFAQALKFDDKEHELKNNILNEIWDSYLTRLSGCKQLILFAQRDYINRNFTEYNQMDTLEDTNTPWDWDHIYPSSWVHGKWYIDTNTRRWSNSIGNLRALSLDENRAENNYLPPSERLKDVESNSFIKDNDWKYWKLIDQRINDTDKEMISTHLKATLHRLSNIYEEWYDTLNVGELFDFEDDIQ